MRYVCIPYIQKFSLKVFLSGNQCHILNEYLGKSAVLEPDQKVIRVMK